MVLHETLYHGVELLVQFIVLLDLGDVDGCDHLEDVGGKLGEGVVVVILTDREVYEVACYAIVVYLH